MVRQYSMMADENMHGVGKLDLCLCGLFDFLPKNDSSENDNGEGGSEENLPTVYLDLSDTYWLIKDISNTYPELTREQIDVLKRIGRRVKALMPDLSMDDRKCIILEIINGSKKSELEKIYRTCCYSSRDYEILMDNMLKYILGPRNYPVDVWLEDAADMGIEINGLYTQRDINRAVRLLYDNNIAFLDALLAFCEDKGDSKIQAEYKDRLELFAEIIKKANLIEADMDSGKTIYESFINENIKSPYIYEFIGDTYINKYVSKEVLEGIGWKNVEQNFVNELRSAMLEGGIVEENSVKWFVATISHESKEGRKVLEDITDFTESSYTENAKGAGYMQITGASQMEFLEYIKDKNGELTPDEEKYLEGFYMNADGKWDNEVATAGMTVAEYIAENYPIESAVYYWIGDKNHLSVDGHVGSINEFIERYADPRDLSFDNDSENLNDRIFLITQYAVNGGGHGRKNFESMMDTNNAFLIKDDNIIFNEISKNFPVNWQARCDVLEKLEKNIYDAK